MTPHSHGGENRRIRSVSEGSDTFRGRSEGEGPSSNTNSNYFGCWFGSYTLVGVRRLPGRWWTLYFSTTSHGNPPDRIRSVSEGSDTFCGRSEGGRPSTGTISNYIGCRWWSGTLVGVRRFSPPWEVVKKSHIHHLPVNRRTPTRVLDPLQHPM